MPISFEISWGASGRSTSINSWASVKKSGREAIRVGAGVSKSKVLAREIKASIVNSWSGLTVALLANDAVTIIQGSSYSGASSDCHQFKGVVPSVGSYTLP